MRMLLAAVQRHTAATGAQRTLTFVPGSEEFGRSDRVFAGYTNQGYVAVQLVQERDQGFDNMLDG
jgi:hypothetical protein